VTMCEGEEIVVNGISYSETGVYTDSLNTTYGCDSLITYMVTVIEQYETFFDEVICEGDSIYIAGAYRSVNGEYIEQLISSNGCDSVLITELFIEPSVNLTAEDAAICFGEEVQLFVEGSDNVRWSPSEGLSCDDCTNPIADPRVTTTYTISAESCMGTTTETSITVVVNNPPSLTLSTNNDVLPGEEIILTAASSDPNAIITWYHNGEVICENCLEYTVGPSLNMSYMVVVEDENGCSNADVIDVNINDACSLSNFEIPNIISPNGDGYNDKFEIKYEGVNEVSLLRIYNRWGELVYETEDISIFWDGTFKGQHLNPGVYIYYLEGLCLDDEAFTKTGNITILK
jgi:gliding motility-associated-like protein